MLIFHDWQILLQTALCFILFKIESNEQDKWKTKSLKPGRKIQSQDLIWNLEENLLLVQHVMRKEFH